jgi:arsenate reductase (thioredoxin)
MPEARIYNVLFLCTGNSARSIIAEVVLNRIGKERFRTFSAGSHPRGEVHPRTLEVLRDFGESVEGLRSKSWDEFSGPGAPFLDFVFTVCSRAAAETCPSWPGQPMTAHWGVEDPAAVSGSEAAQIRAFRDAYHYLQTRVRLFASLRIELLDRLSLQREVRKIGETIPRP